MILYPRPTSWSTFYESILTIIITIMRTIRLSSNELIMGMTGGA